MSRGHRSRTALLIDDEPEYLGWVVDYLVSLGLKIEIARNLKEALTALQSREFRLILVDMNIPIGGMENAPKPSNPVAERYPGIIAAVNCRSAGYGAHQVIAYTVHDDDAADAELGKLSCRYVLKGRPEALKRVIESSLRPHPPSRAR